MNNEIWDCAILELLTDLELIKQTEVDIDTLYDKVCKTILCENDAYLSCFSLTGKSKKQFKYHKPYWNHNLTMKWKEMRNFEKSFQKYKGRGTYKIKIRNDYKLKQREFNKLLRKTERQYCRNLSNDINISRVSNPKQFWDYISKLGPRKNRKVSEKVYINGESGQTIDNIPTLLNKWENAFNKLYSNNVDSIDNIVDNHDNSLNEGVDKCNISSSKLDENNYLNKPILLSEVEEVVKSLKNNKAAGFDGIQNETLKNKDVIEVLHKLFQYIFESGCIPSIWKRAIISPIPKSSLKDPHVQLNYRGINLLFVIGKTFTALLNKRIVTYLEENKILCEEQNGFRPGRSCEEHIFTLTSIIRNRIGMGQNTYVAFIDFQKAFDWVNRKKLINKLFKYGLQGKILTSIKNLYTKTNAQVKINEYLTGIFETSSGVRQGDNMSPVLFNIFINDLIKEINHLKQGVKIDAKDISILAYADDIVLIAPEPENLQNMLDSFYNWCKKFSLHINVEKSQILHFRNKKSARTDFQFIIGNLLLEKVYKYKYLGLVLDEHLSYSNIADILCNSATRALGALNSKTRNCKD